MMYERTHLHLSFSLLCSLMILNLVSAMMRLRFAALSLFFGYHLSTLHVCLTYFASPSSREQKADTFILTYFSGTITSVKHLKRKYAQRTSNNFFSLSSLAIFCFHCNSQQLSSPLSISFGVLTISLYFTWSPCVRLFLCHLSSLNCESTCTLKNGCD